MDRKLSIVAMFDDLDRCANELMKGSDDVFLNFVNNQEECRKNWLNVSMEFERLLASQNKLQAEYNAMETKLIHCRSQFAAEMAKRRRVEQERDSLKKQIQIIREVLLEGDGVNDETRALLSMLNTPKVHEESPSKRLNRIDESGGSILSPSEFDVTEEDTTEYSQLKRKRSKNGNRKSETKKRPSAPPVSDDTPPKRVRNSQEIVVDGNPNDSLIAVTRISFNNGAPISASSKIEARPPPNRSFSEPAPGAPTEVPLSRFPLHSEGGGDDESDEIWVDSSAETQTIPPTPFPRNTKIRQLSHTHLGTKNHTFCAKTVVMPEKCIGSGCDKRIKFGKLAYKCRDCRIVCCSGCQTKVQTPCSPVVNTPRNTVNAVVGDFAPTAPPYIPPIILHCVIEVEQRGLDDGIGLYRVPGRVDETQKLVDKFLRGKTVPCLSKVEIPVICSCIKNFLRNLREPLLTFALWHEFAKAAAISNEEASLGTLMSIVSRLPDANKDTLAYLILHMQLITRTPVCNMNATNIAVCFGPSIVQNSCPDPDNEMISMETAHQKVILQRLLAIPEGFWSDIVSHGVPRASTPSDRETPRFGSVRSARVNHTPFRRVGTPARTRTYKPQQYFSSPSMQ